MGSDKALTRKVRSSLSLAQARRVALAAQGFARPRPSNAGARHLAGVVDRLHLIQIDSVNVVARAHLLPFFARLGPYDPNVLARLSSQKPRKMVEYWAHEASFVAPETTVLLRWRMARLAQSDGWISRIIRQHPDLVPQVLGALRERGPSTARELQEELGSNHPADSGNWGWNWSAAKQTLEWLFAIGEISAAGRNASFERIYDFSEAVLPSNIVSAPTPDPSDAMRALIELAARAHGVGTVSCLRDYFRLPAKESTSAVTELVESGILLPVQIEGWAKPAFMHRDAAVPRSVDARALLAPFDPMVFERTRLEALFGMRYRIEIYTPAAKRVHGYYVLPFLYRESMAARVDLKADRQAGVLRVQNVHYEDDVQGRQVGRQRKHVPDIGEVEIALREELESMALWLGLADLDFSGLKGI